MLSTLHIVYSTPRSLSHSWNLTLIGKRKAIHKLRLWMVYLISSLTCIASVKNWPQLCSEELSVWGGRRGIGLSTCVLTGFIFCKLITQTKMIVSRKGCIGRKVLSFFSLSLQLGCVNIRCHGVITLHSLGVTCTPRFSCTRQGWNPN